ncbi:hypothetical protein HC723_14730 [Vibrio sp. S11_S32]|uniref:DUF3150 domain-containing protein n=1 Tax=Vibrio sp. S11_S32 TaxID=2720225 RepID=UPI0016807497|nr:DUF3150 domain-containing protein [Vibrio sp. S11_S32]MBD1577664.1 hypothetical protein [Vibrio sp. S11_S32]
MQNTNNIQLPNGYTVIYINATQWTAKRSLKAEDLNLSQEITKEVATLGSLNCFDPKNIKMVRNLINQAYSYCYEFGVKFGDGVLLPISKKNWLIDRLTEVQHQIIQTRDLILSTYMSDLDGWVAEVESKVTGLGRVVRKQAFTPEYIERQIQFSWHGIEDKVGSLGSVLMDEMASKARKKLAELETKKQANHGRLKLTRMDLRLFEAIQRKLMINQSLDARVTPLLDAVVQLFELAEGEGQLPTKFNVEYMKTLTLMAHPESTFGLSDASEEATDSSFEFDFLCDDEPDASAASDEVNIDMESEADEAEDLLNMF